MFILTKNHPNTWLFALLRRSIALFAGALILSHVLAMDVAGAADYYVDATQGSDNASGLSADNAWQTISKVNSSSATLDPGDRILLKRGERWSEKLVIPQSGIIISAYGQGTPPLLDGLTEAISPSYQWALAQSLSSETRKVWYLKGGARDFSPNLAVLRIHGQLKRLAYRGNDLPSGLSLKNHEYARINSTPDYGSWTFYVRIDDASPESNEATIFLAKDHDTLLDTNNQSDLLIENISVRGAIKTRTHSNPAILLRNATRVTIRNTSISFSKIAISTSSWEEGPYFANDCVIEKNKIHDNVESGIYFRGSAMNNIIRSNHIFDNYNKGLGDYVGDNLAIGFTGPQPASDRSGNIIESNIIENNGSYDWGDSNDDNAICLYTTNDTIVRYNKIHNNKQGAFYASIKSSSNSFIYNEVIGNEVRSWALSSKDRPTRTHDGRLIFVLNSDGTKIHNNTIVANKLLIKQPPTAYNGISRLIGIEGNSRNTEFQNNILSSNRLTSIAGTPAVLILSWAKSSLIDNNLYFDNTSIGQHGNQVALFYSPRTGAHTNLKSWKRAGHDRYSLEGSLLFADPENGDYDLVSGSNAINRGANLGHTRDIRGQAVGQQPSIGAYEYISPE